MLKIDCAICGNKGKQKQLYKANLNLKRINEGTFSARRIPDRVHYRFVECQKCGLIFSNPIFSAKKISSLYLKSGFNYKEESEYLKETYGNYLDKILPDIGREKIKLLDIGCGNGFFLEKVKKMGIKNIYGIEPGKASVEKASVDIKNRIKVSILKENIFKNGSFDIITCFHTLDHIVDPNSFLKITYSLLKKGGKIIFIVHNTKGLSVKLFGEKSPIFDIEHIYLFDNKTLGLLFRRNKFRRIKVVGVKNTYPLEYWLKMIPVPGEFKKTANKLLVKLGIGKLPLSINAGNIAIYAFK